MHKSAIKNNWLYIGILLIVFIISFIYIFDPKIDLNGDNCTYYLLAKSIASGKGFVDITSPALSPTNIFPPGYPLLMAVNMIITGPGIISQKIMNGLFLIIAIIILYILLNHLLNHKQLAFTISCISLINFYLYKFAKMMMSEMSFLLFSCLALYFYNATDEDQKPWKNYKFYLSIFCMAYIFHIRTQGVTLFLSLILYLLISKKWRHLLTAIPTYLLFLAPWMIRNRIRGLSNRYLRELLEVNPWRPEEGSASIFDLFKRLIDNVTMLVTKAIPDSLLPAINLNYDQPVSVGLVLLGIVILTIVIYGIFKLPKFKFLILGYIVANIIIIGFWSAPGGNRYLTTIIPFLYIGLILGLYHGAIHLIRYWKKTAGQFSPLWLLSISLLILPRLVELHQSARASYPSNYYNYFLIGAEINKKMPPNTVVCCRKPYLFYMFGNRYSCKYLFTQDDKQLIKKMVKDNVDYVILDQLGFSSTALYLYPAILKNKELFAVVIHLKNPDTMLFKFDREQARRLFPDS
ncbi:MAG: glycosyltransferase family 39 protein [Candidatus Marinimicrobia bacterium]|jgi:uncharacterized membrane protein|nr:glycosyltransferase family 39 protein [Candidatus Neomarinimicrobiota bacterium]MCK9483817.1 glycosyltransferase family 39 protein [Candidatus Neomarinimicrobiota bacterium]